jgi:hypothetical protein
VVTSGGDRVWNVTQLSTNAVKSTFLLSTLTGPSYHVMSDLTHTSLPLIPFPSPSPSSSARPEREKREEEEERGQGETQHDKGFMSH